MEVGMPRIWFAQMQANNYSEDALCIQGYYVSKMLGLQGCHYHVLWLSNKGFSKQDSFSTNLGNC
jgi:hypothetical protein